MPSRRQPPPVQADQGEGHRGRGEGQARAQRGEAQAILQVQREGEEEPAEDGHHREQGGDRDRHAGHPQHPARDQRRPAGLRDPALGGGEGGGQGHARGHQDPAPERPVFGLAEHEREDEREHGRGEQGQAGHVEGAAGLALAVRQRPGADGQQRHADGHVHQEHRPPARAEQVRADQQAAGQLPHHRAASQHRGVAAHRAGPGRARVGALDQAEHLRDHHRGARSLGEAQRDQLTGRARPGRSRARPA